MTPEETAKFVARCALEITPEENQTTLDNICVLLRQYNMSGNSFRNIRIVPRYKVSDKSVVLSFYDAARENGSELLCSELSFPPVFINSKSYLLPYGNYLCGGDYDKTDITKCKYVLNAGLSIVPESTGGLPAELIEAHMHLSEQLIKLQTDIIECLGASGVLNPDGSPLYSTEKLYENIHDPTNKQNQPVIRSAATIYANVPMSAWVFNRIPIAEADFSKAALDASKRNKILTKKEWLQIQAKRAETSWDVVEKNKAFFGLVTDDGAPNMENKLLAAYHRHHKVSSIIDNPIELMQYPAFLGYKPLNFYTTSGKKLSADAVAAIMANPGHWVVQPTVEFNHFNPNVPSNISFSFTGIILVGRCKSRVCDRGTSDSTVLPSDLLPTGW